MSVTCLMKRGLKYQLPESAKNRELLVTTDTREIFMGNGPDMPLTPIREMGQIARILAEGVTLGV